MSERKNYVDIAKGLGIISIMLLHYEDGYFPSMVNRWGGCFMIAIFYFVSGYLSSGRALDDWNVWFNKRKRQLIMPYIWFSILIVSFDIILYLFDLMPGKIVLRDIYKTFTLRGIGTLWFLPAIFFGEAIARCFIKGALWKKSVILAVSVIYSGLYYKWNALYGNLNEIYRIIDAPFRTLVNIADAWWIIVSGYMIGKYFKNEIESVDLRNRLIITLSILGVYTALICKIASRGVLVPVLGSLGIIMLSTLIEKTPISGIWQYFGRNSLIIMATHYSILQVACELINKHYTGSSHLGGVSALYWFAVSLILEIPLIWIINRYFPFLIGKKFEK